MRRVISAMAAALAAAAILLIPSPATADSICGNEADDFVPALTGSQWVVEAFINGDPQTSVLVLTPLGQLAVTTVVDPLGVYQGQYAHLPFNSELDWYAVDLPNTGSRYTYFGQAIGCGSSDNVLSMTGPVVEYNVGQVGIFYATRVV